MGTLRRRLILSHIALVLLIIVLLAIALIYVLESQVILVNLSNSLARQASLLVESTADYPGVWRDRTVAETFVARFQNRLTAQLMLLDNTGRVLASSDPADAALLGEQLSSPPVAVFQRGETLINREYSQNLRTEIADVWVPATGAEDQVLGAVRLTHRLATVRERFVRLRSLILQVLAAGLLLGILAALLLAESLERPISRLTAAVYRLAQGDEPQFVEERGPTELQLLAGAFNTLIERLRILRRARRQLLANLVHELGRPLGALRSASQALLEGAQEEPELRQVLIRGMDHELSVLQRVLNDLTRFYDRDLGAMELHLEPTAMAPWLTALLSPWRETAQKKGIGWESSIPVDLPTMAVDADRLAQALGNLMSNAIKFTPEEGLITVTAGTEDEAVWIRVEDSGPGIPSREQKRIFEPFVRVQGERMPQGMGLGLTIARDLIQAHEGRLTVESTLGGGSRFTIWLPHPRP